MDTIGLSPTYDPTLQYDENVMKKLRDWRYAESRTQQIPAYWILSNRMIGRLAQDTPRTMEELEAVPGLGKSRIQKYGEAVLQAVREGLDTTGLITLAQSLPTPKSWTMPTTVETTYEVPAHQIEAVLLAAGCLSPKTVMRQSTRLRIVLTHTDQMEVTQ